MLQSLEYELQPLRKQLVDHDIYARLRSLDDIRVFMEQHVYAVWDFMSLLKALQQQVTCVRVPWVPAEEASLARFINEIVHGEESDVNENGEPSSHYEMYLDAMREIDADTAAIEGMVEKLRNGVLLQEAVTRQDIPDTTKDFVRYTFEVINTGKPHLVASAFTFGREDIIPDMFFAIIDKAEKENRSSYPKLTYYLNRHIELDGDEHGPLSLRLVSELCGKDKIKWQEATEVAKEALKKRIQLWDGVVKLLS